MWLWKSGKFFWRKREEILVFFFFFLVLGVLNFKYYFFFLNILTRNVFIINTFYSPFSVPSFEKKSRWWLKIGFLVNEIGREYSRTKLFDKYFCFAF